MHPVRGRGEYFNSFNENHLIKHIQMEIYTKSEQAGDIAQLIVETAHVNADSEGLVCFVPVNDLLWIHDKRSAIDSDFQFHP
ncbi:P-II family nitrogen regulator [Simiduia agarivorans]|uniref:P-II family nitrogen regulator n=1 Tax=Simiduia agarivorans TaxID=447471 RepID=UPI001FCBCAEF|nr:P-II family nitrogen regulator [Simiduia agarivorans]